MDYSSPSTLSYPLSPTSTAPSSVPPVTSTSGRTPFVSSPRRSSGKRFSDAINTAKMAVVGGTPNRLSTHSSAPISKPHNDHVEHRAVVPHLPPLLKQTSHGPLSRLRDHLRSPTRDILSPSPPRRAKPYNIGKTVQRPQKNEARCLQSVMPGLFMAFEDDARVFQGAQAPHIPSEEELRTGEGQRFTHIIRISTLKSACHPPEIKYSMDSHKTNFLELSIYPHSHRSYEIQMRILASVADGDEISPQAAQRLYNKFGDIDTREPYDEGITLLTRRQLLAARDFIHYSGYDHKQRNGARILITAPRDHCTDVISVVTCYLAYITRNQVVSILRQINKHEGFLGVWKHTISAEGARLVQDIVHT